MHEHDLDLIAEHASGFLTGADASRAADYVRTCDRCAAEFEDQRHIRTLLAEAPAPSLSEFERASVRRSVLDTVAPPSRSRVTWQRKFLAATSVAAAVLVTAVGIGVVSQLDGGDDSMTLADGGESNTTVAAADMRVPPADGDDDGADEEIGALAADQADEEQAEALSDDAGAESTEYSPNLLIDAGEVAAQDQLDPLLAEMTALVAETSDVVSVEDATAFGAACVSDVEREVLAVVIATIDGQPAQVFLIGDRIEPTVLYLSGTDCGPLSP